MLFPNSLDLPAFRAVPLSGTLSPCRKPSGWPCTSYSPQPGLAGLAILVSMEALSWGRASRVSQAAASPLLRECEAIKGFRQSGDGSGSDLGSDSWVHCGSREAVG